MILFLFDLRLFTSIFIGLLLLFLPGCAVHETIIESESKIYVGLESRNSEIKTIFAPLFILPQWQKSSNRIGKVIAEKNDEVESISIDVAQPVIYNDMISFTTKRAVYTNLIYRVHFPNTPFSLIPFHFTAGSNVGLLVIVTLNAAHLPILVTTAQTCGCYAAVTPTAHLSLDAYPEDWNGTMQKVYGELLPAQLPAYTLDDVMLVTVRPEVHRIMNLQVSERKELTGKTFLPAASMDLQSLKTLELADGTTTSFYYDTWPLRGHVKGSIKLWESLLISLISFDFYVGMDKEYGDTAISGNPFYTSLKVWNRKISDMNNFPQFLDFLGWKL